MSRPHDELGSGAPSPGDDGSATTTVPGPTADTAGWGVATAEVAPATAPSGNDGDADAVVPGGEGELDERPKRRRWARRALAVVGIVAVAAGAAAAAVTLESSDDDTGDGSGTVLSLGTAAVERRTLEEHAELDGTLGYGEPEQVSVPGRGTITGVPEAGTVVDRGQTLVEVDGHPIPLLVGERPLWRAVGPGVTNGVDVQQVEANLVALEIASEAELGPDQTWTDATTAAVEEWQASLGLDATGTIAPGSVVFQPGAVRVAEHLTPEGGALGGGPVLSVTGTTREITVDLEATRQGLLEVDQSVDVVLPDGSETTGTVQVIGTVATSESAGGEASGGEEEADPTIEVTIALDDPATGGDLDQAPVTVRAVTSAATDVLAVPLEALLVQAGGGFAVEVQGNGGSDSADSAAGTDTEFVPVELGAFADGWVEVTGDLDEGDEVVVPVDQ